MPVWGWGEEAHDRSLKPAAEAELDSRLGLLDEPLAPVPIHRFPQSPSRLSAGQADLLRKQVAPDGYGDDIGTRVLHAAGKSYPDLLRMRDGAPAALPDAVLCPSTAAEVASLLDVCAAHSIAVVPFGGGTSVVGGVEPLAGSHAAVIALDLARLSGLVELDGRSRIARLLPGMTGPQAEAALNPHGFTIGHFPQSFMHATIGGFVATRSAGQASTGYGRIDSNVIGLELVTPVGMLGGRAFPGTAAGPDLRELAIGSEGTLGVITEATLRVSPLPEKNVDRAWFVESFEAGCEILRRLEQAGVAPAIARLSDERETEVSMLLAGDGTATKALRSWLRLRRMAGGCLLITCWEGSRTGVDGAVREAKGILRSMGAAPIGSLPAKAWRRGRYDGPYLRDALMGRGLLVDTLETAASWSELQDLHRSVGDALRSALGAFGGDPIVMCHVSHLYPTGASLYFTWLGRQPGKDLESRIANWWSVKQSATDAIVRSGGTITHHHAVGSDHAGWLESEIGSTGVSALAALKGELDPAGIMNPGKLLPR